MKKLLLHLFFTLLLTGAVFQLAAATVTWDGGAGTNNWNDALNWDTDALPTSADIADLDGNVVVLTASTQVQRVLIDGSGQLTVNVGVTLTIDGFAGADDGLEIQGSATVTNNGTIAISNINTGNTDADGLYIKGTFINNGIMTIDGVGQHGLYQQDGTFTNNSTGSISITNYGQGDSGADGIYLDDNGGTSAMFTNNGTITVIMTSSDDGIYVNDGATLVNNSMITVGGAAGDNGIRIDDGAVFNNNSSATFTINSTPDDQLFLDNDGAFNNTGTVNVNNAPDNGMYVTDEGVFTNNASGVVNITNAGNYAIQIDANSSTANISNSGTINITGGSNDGIRLQEEGVFNNNVGGNLNITSAGDEGIQIDDATPVSTFNNSGTVTISTPTDHGMEVFGTFNNMAGGTFNATNCPDDGIRMRNTGVFNNDGAIVINGSGSEDIETDANVGATFSNTSNATFNPGVASSTGLLEIKDDFDLGAATVTFEINGTTPVTNFDQIQNTSSTNSITVTNATMYLDWGAFIPAVNDEFKVIDGSGQVNGTFSSVTSSNSDIQFSVDYSSNTAEVLIKVTGVIPVEMTYFIGNKTAEGNLLEWETATEEINLGFDVEKSVDGKNWEKIGFIEGNGTTYEVSNYEFLDENVTANLNYYRLKQLDTDGKFEYSNTISIIGEKQNTAVWKTYPNPVKSQLIVEGFEGTLTIYNVLGQPLKTVNILNQMENITLTDLETGQYIIEMKANDGTRTVRQIVKIEE